MACQSIRPGCNPKTAATTHHNALTLPAADFPEVSARRVARFVESGALATAGGLSYGIDRAPHVVDSLS